MATESILTMSKLKCNSEKTNHSLFFSLVDYRNNLFNSNDPNKIMEFYDGFGNRDQFIHWMRERPKRASYIHEVDAEDVKKNGISKMDSKKHFDDFFLSFAFSFILERFRNKKGKIFILILLIYFFINAQIKEHKIDNIEILMLKKIKLLD